MKKNTKNNKTGLSDEPIGRVYSSTELKEIGKENSAALKTLRKKKKQKLLTKIKTS
jgi:hypothetical protein